MKKIDLENRIKELELELNNLKSSQSDIQKLQENDLRFRNLIELYICPILILKGENMVLETANDPILKIFNIGKEAIVKPLAEIFPEIKEQPFLDLLLNVYYNNVSHYVTEQPAYFLRENGEKEIVYFNFAYYPYKENNGTVSGVLVYATDVTEMVLARKKIEDSNKRYNMMLMQSPFAFAVLKGKNMVITLANDSVKEMWGKGKNLEGKSLFEVLPELKDSEFPGLLDKVYTTGTPFSGEELLAPVFRNGKLEDVYFNFVYQPYFEADETISGVTIIAIEVTNEVIAKQKIKDSQQELQNIFMQAPFALNIYEGKELVISLANKLFCEIIGKTESEILGKKLFDAFPETATQGLDKIISDIFSTGIPFKGNEFPVHFSKHGNEFKGYFDFIYQPIFDYNKNVSGIINAAIDVSDKVLARKKIEESEQRLRLATQTSGVGIWEWNVITNKIRWDAQMFHIYGVVPSADGFVDYSTWSNAVIKEDRAEQERILQDTVRNVGSSKRSFKIIRASDGMLSDIEAIETVRANAEGNAEWVVGTNLDVTEQVLARKKVEASEFRFHNLVYTSPSMIAIFKGEDMIIEIANDAIIESWGKGKDIFGKSLLSIMPEIIEQGFDKILSEVYKTGIPFHA